MSAPADLLRPGLLVGTRIAVTAVGDGDVAQSCRELLAGLGAQVEEPGDDPQALVVDAAGAAGPALGDSLSEVWAAVHAYAGRLIESERGGRILLVAPPDEAAAAALENLARTLSIEWARRAITVVAIARGNETSAADVATLVAYLCSAAGEYFSGCLLDLRSV